jgi:hypothetical protein
MAVLQNGLKCSHTPCMLLFHRFAPPTRDFAKLNLLFLNPHLIFEIGPNNLKF